MAMLFSEHQLALFEGKQAEEYKAKKAAEKEANDNKKAADDRKAQYRYNTNSLPDDDHFPMNKSYKQIEKEAGKNKDTRVRRDANRRFDENKAKGKNSNGMTGADMARAYDASRRKERTEQKKVKHESFGIFAEMVDTDEPTQYGDQMTRDDLVPDDEVCNGIQHQYNGIEKTGNGIDDNGAPVDESYGIFEPMMEGKLKDLDKKLRDNKSKQASDDDPFNGKYNVTSPDGSRTDKFGSMKRRFEVGPYATDWKTPSEKHIKKAYDKKRKEYGYV